MANTTPVVPTIVRLSVWHRAALDRLCEVLPDTDGRKHSLTSMVEKLIEDETRTTGVKPDKSIKKPEKRTWRRAS